MKTTIKVKPVLVESKNPTNLLINTINNRLLYDCQDIIKTHAKYQQLNLVSLEPDEKIENGDKYYSDTFKHIYETPCLPLSIKDLQKVIASQNQLSSELIHQLVNEYNTYGNMKEFEIYIEKRFLMCKHCGSPYPYESNDGKCATCRKSGLGIMSKPEPKLTNGFITVKKDLNFKNTDGINHLEWIYNRLIYVHGENPNVDYMIKLKAISDSFHYTEEEVKQLIILALKEDWNLINPNGWFEQHKKK